MPHCIIEHSTDLKEVYNIKEAIKDINLTVENSGLFDNNSIKTRAISFDHFLVGGIQKPFIHITLKLLGGRTLLQKQTLAKSLLKTTSELFKKINDISVEIIELNTKLYFKQTDL